MTEDNKSSLTLIIGIALGAIIVYLFLKNKTPTPSPPIQTFNNSPLESRLDSIEQQLHQLQQIQLHQLNSPSQQIQPQPIQQIQQPIQQPIQQQTNYNNSEKTNFILNKDGDIIGMETIRNAKIG